METADFLITIILSLFGGGTLGVLGVKYMNRRVDNAKAEQTKAEAHRIFTDARAKEIDNMRAIVDEYKEMSQAKSDKIAALEASIVQLEARVDKVEERERHMLIRAGVHEAWDQMAFAFISQHDSTFQPPPPLLISKELTE